MTAFANFIEVCESTCSRYGRDLAYRHVRADGRDESLSFAELRDDAVAVAARLQQVGAPGARALIVCPQGLDYVRAVWGCFYAGVVAVPAYAPRNTHHFERLMAIVADARADILVLGAEQVGPLRAFADKSGLLSSLRWVVVGDAVGGGNDGPGWTAPPIVPHDLALLQYTSGSTAAPKGVMVSHANLLANQRMIEDAFRHRTETISVLWTPLFHDMGLMALLQGVYGGFATHLTNPVDFLIRPHRWLEILSELGATATTAPDFAYRLCVEKVTDAQCEGLDLSRLETVVVGAEPIAAATLEAFATRFAPCGFRKQAFYPSYGLAEATLLVSGRRPRGAAWSVMETGSGEAGPQYEPPRVCCGLPADGSKLCIVDPMGNRLAEGEVGEIWVGGPHVAQGYWNDPAATEASFAAITADGEGPFLRTGDLGCLHRGELVVTGRIKDLIIVRGANHYPHDIEASAVAAHPSLVAGGCAAFQDDMGALHLVAEVAKNAVHLDRIEAAIAGAVAQAHGLAVGSVVLVKRNTLPRTSSGKIQRHAAKSALADGSLATLHTSDAGPDGANEPAVDLPALLGELDEEARPAIMTEHLLGLLARQIERPAAVLSPDQSLAALGVDSIGAVRFKQAIEAAIGVDLPTEPFFADMPLVQLSEDILRCWTEGAAPVPRQPNPALDGGRVAATASQMALWAQQQRDPAATAYNEGFFAQIEGTIDHVCLERALSVLVARHPALRTTFHESGGQLWQDIAADHTVTLSSQYCATPEAAEAAARAIVDGPFDLAHEAWRCGIVDGPDRSYLAFAVHHLIFDMWSCGIFLEELGEVYRTLDRGGTPAAASTAAASAWLDLPRIEAEQAASHDGQAALAQWGAELAGAPASSRIPPTVETQTLLGKVRRHRFVVPANLLAELKAFARSEDATLPQLLASSFFLLLSKYSGQDDLVVGIPFLGRNSGDALSALGYFVNLAPIRLNGVDRCDVVGLVGKTKRAFERARQRTSVPFAQLVQAHGPGGASWIQTSFSMLPPPAQGRAELAPFVLGLTGGTLELGTAQLLSCEHARQQAQFDCAWTAMEWGDEIHGYIDVRDGLYTAGTIDRLLDNYLTLLGAMVRDGRQPVRFLPVVGESEAGLLRSHLRSGPAARRLADPQGDESAVGRFRAVAAEHAARIALSGPGFECSYTELDVETDRIARALVERGVEPGDRIALAFADRTGQAVASLAVLKAAAVFVPLDLAHPADRLCFYLRDAQASLVLADAASVEQMRQLADTAAVLAIGDLATDPRGESGPAPAEPIVLPSPQSGEAIAYCIYTSGSTGQPKGVSVPHRGLCNLIEWHWEAFNVTPLSRASLIAGAAFDVAVWEIWPYLCMGGTLLEPPAAVRTDVAALAQWIADARLSHSFVPTAIVEALLAADREIDLGELRYLLTAGDRLRIAARPGMPFQLVNAYGPTENAVITTAGTVADSPGLPDIGRPISNQDLYILDRHGNEVPIGMPGELFIGGEGLARAYHARPALTAERFVPHPAALRPGSRLYASGDIVRLDEDGLIHFVERNDDQVKIRGHRIELGEIEAVLLRHPAIGQCKAMVQESASAGPWIAAYVSPAGSGEQEIDDAGLRRWLAQRLPSHMVPLAFRWLDELPVDANGKIDRKRLPRLDDPAVQNRVPAAFDGPLEEEVAQLFADVVGIAQVGREDDFFALGGHSLLTGKLVQWAEERLGVHLTMADVFANPQVDKLAALLHDRREQGVPHTFEPIPRPDHIPLGSAQRRLWLLHRLDPQSSDYHMSGVVRLQGAIDQAALETAFRQVVARHEALGTCFPERNGEPVQEIAAAARVPFECVSLELPDGDAHEAAAFRLVRQWDAEPFCLAQGPMLRARLLRLTDGESWLHVCIHHIVADGQSLKILLDEVATAYRDASDRSSDRQPPAGPPPSSLHYADYVLAKGSGQARAKAAADLRYWQSLLAELPAGLIVPSLPPADTSEAPQGDEVRANLSASLAARVRSRAAQWKTTEFVVYLATLALLLGRTSGEDRFLVGVAHDGRDRPEWQNVVGFFVELLPILVELPEGGDFHALLHAIRTRYAEAIEHDGATYEAIVNGLSSPRGGTERKPIRVMFDFEQLLPQQIDLGEVRASVIERPDTSAKFDLTFRCRTVSGEPSIAVNFRTRTYRRAVIEELLSSFIVLLEQVTDRPEALLAELALVSDANADILIRCGEGPVHALPVGSTVERFEALAAASPELPALIGAGGGERLSYGELNEKANRLAQQLREAGLSRGGVGALCLPPGPPFVICALAVRKLGAAYLPIDPAYPPQRRQLLLDDSGAVILICAEPPASEEAPQSVALLSWAALTAVPDDTPATNPGIPIDGDDPAYLVYTSGTTGRPKGVVVPERGLANLCQWHARTYRLDGRGDRVRGGQTAGIGFDAAVWEIWPYLLSGASIWFASPEARTSPRAMADWLREARITHVFLSTPIAHELLADRWCGTDHCEYLLTGGEKLTARAPSKASYRLVNHYGPSENAVVATAAMVTPDGPLAPPIGEPIDNVQALVLDRNGCLLPAGVAGELCLAGLSLALGYCGDPDAVEHARFFAWPAAEGMRCYRTGDRVCWNEDGSLEYLGRIDDQIKLRGIRIEPGEIERALLVLPGVRSALVEPVTHPVTGIHLAAYAVLDPGALSTGAELRRELARTLPPAMLPAFVQLLDAFPLTRNGKVDRAALPAPDWDAAMGARPLASPTERTIAAIWSTFLGCEVADAEANFFALGGHSLLAARVAAAIEQQLGQTCDLPTVMDSASLAELAERVDAGSPYRAIARADPAERIPLAPLQRRLWLMQQFAPESVDYNVVGAFALDGECEPELLRSALGLLIERHGVLRTLFAIEAGEPFQRVLDPTAVDQDLLGRIFSWEECSLPSIEAEEAALDQRMRSLANEPFDLERGPLLRMQGLQFADKRAVLVVAVHHIIVDGWSVDVLLRDLFVIYRSLIEGREPDLPDLPVDYGDYSVWASKHVAAREDELERFWQDYLRDPPTEVLLPGSAGRSSDGGEGETWSLAIDQETADQLHLLARELRVSLFELLFAIHLLWLYQLTRSTDLIVGAPVHQRGRPELENLAGFFVNTLPLRGRFARDWSFRQVLARLRDDLAAVRCHDDLPYDRIAERLAPGGEPLFRTLFDLQQHPPLAATFGALSVTAVRRHVDAPLADLAVTIAPLDQGLVWSCTFQPNRFERTMVEGWGGRFRELLGAVLADIDQTVRDLSAARSPSPRTSARRQHVPQGRTGETLTVQLARQVATGPDRPALTSESEVLSYLELDFATNQIAHYLQAQGVRPGAVVGIDARHSPDSVLAIIGVLKAGAAYAAIDLSMPPVRLRDLLADAGCEHLLTHDDSEIAGIGGAIVPIGRAHWQDFPRHQLGVSVIPQSAACLVYTSGTTGLPKAAVLSHGGIANYIDTVRDRFGISPEDRFLLFAPLSFDASLEEIFTPLCSGASLHVGPPECRNAVPSLVELCSQAEISVLTLPTAYWRLLAEHVAAFGAATLPSVRLISVGGEEAPLALAQQWNEQTEGRIELWNIYGPSECSIGCVVDRFPDPDLAANSSFVPLRDAVANIDIHVLDDYLDPVPPGVDGEVYIGGAGLAQGYHRRPALTAERFVPNPFGKPGSRLYRTGDRVRMDADGGLQFLGRSDFQVKIDGMRVEPGEIEAVLAAHPQVSIAVVIPRQIGSIGNHLAAYVTRAPGAEDPSPEVLLAHLGARLPRHMVPAFVQVLERFPLTVHQKIDRAALAERAMGQNDPIDAATATEALVLSIWRDLLPDARFGVTDDLFGLGAGSLLVIRLISAIEARSGIRLAVRDVADCPTVRQLADHMDRLQLADRPPTPPLTRIDQLAVPLSGAQARLWYLHQLDPLSSAYNLPNGLHLEGSLRHDALAAAIATTIADNESLRTVFRIEQERPLQVVLEDVDAQLEYDDFSHLDLPEAEHRAAELGLELLAQPFFLDRGPLCRFHLVRLRPDRHILIAIFHHIVVDGWSVQLWNRQLADAYNRHLGLAASIEPREDAERALQYRDFSEWQRRYLEEGEHDRQLRHWREVLGGALPALELPTDFARPANPGEAGAIEEFRVEDALAGRLSALAREHRVSLFTVLLSAYIALLHRYSGQTDIVVGFPSAGRERPEIDGIVGFFVNTLVARCTINRGMPFARLIEQVRDVCLDALTHQDVALEEIAAQANAERRGGRSEIFQTMFSYHEGELTGAEAMQAITVSNFEIAQRTAKFDLSLATWTTGAGLFGAIEYRTELFVPDTVAQLARHYRNLLEAAAADPEVPVDRMRMLDPDEHSALVHALDGPSLPPSPDLHTHQLFEQRAAAHPDRCAVTCGNQQLSYAELNARANLLAHALLERGAQAEDRVVLMLERDIGYLIALLACLKAGTAFVPLDPGYPLDKRREIVCESGARILVSEPAHRAQVEEMALELTVIDLQDAVAQALDADPVRTRNPDLPLTPQSLAYVIYTSGSTGKPKGAMIEHGGLLNHLLGKVDGLAITEDDVVAEMAATTFDVSIWQYLVALLAGGRTAIMPGDAAWIPRDLLLELARQEVTIFESVPSHMKVILDEFEADRSAYALPRLRIYVSNAEALTPALCRRWLANLPGVRLFNTYGATECSDDTSHLAIDAPPGDELPYMPIHGTLPNLTTYLLDEALQPVPIGVTGEVYIGGIGVGRGYCGDPVRTAAAYLPDPYSAQPGRRMYKTGDLARLRTGGMLEFLGRADFQVKIRGQRVELGEIEAALGKHEALRDVLVAAAPAPHGGTCLIAYVVPARHPAPSADTLRDFVGARLPEHMVPAAFVFMDMFPLNANGKVDRKQLPEVSADDLLQRHVYEAPETDTEHMVAELWSSLLGIKQIGALDGFFELGGHSLLAADLMIKIRARFGIEIGLRDFFKHANLRDFATLIDQRRGAVAIAPPVARRYPVRDRYDLAPCQIPEWYAYRLDPESPVYNICLCDLFLHGQLDREAFLHAWQLILDRHEVLQARFGYEDGKPFQTVDRRERLRAEDVFRERFDLESDEDVLAEANRLAGELGAAPFDFELGPLFRLHLVSYGSDRHQLIFVVHHIIWDETSLINLTAELSECYNAFRQQREPVLPALSASYFDYVQWTHETLASGALEPSRQYWLELYRTMPPPLDLPTDYPRPDLMSFRGDAIESWLPRTLVRKLESVLKRDGTTLFLVKLALLAHYLHLMTGQDDFVIGCPIAGRSEPEFKPLLGLFATPMPIRCTITPGMTFSDLLEHVSARALDAFDHSRYPSNRLIEELAHEKDLSRPKLFSVMFGVQNDKTEAVGKLAFDGLDLSFEEVIDTENKTSRFDLNFVVDQFGSDIKFSCIYNTDLFHRETVALMVETMTAMLGAVLEDPDRPLNRYAGTAIDPAALDALESGPKVTVDPLATLHAGLERQAALVPDRLAVVEGEHSCTYAELNQRANRLAHHLRASGLEPGSMIAVLHEPSIDMLVSLYAVLKVGCCYLPLIPEYPNSRIEAIIRDAGADVVLTTRALEEQFPLLAAEIVCVDAIVDLLACYVADDLPPVDPGSLAYTIFTSGTTGRPRGIQIEHRAVTNLLAALQHEYALGDGDRVLFHTPVTFDVSIEEIFWPLSCGARVVIAPARLLKGAREIAALIDREAVSFVQFVPAVLEAMVDARRKREVSSLSSLRQVICGGAVLPKALDEAFRAEFGAALANHYGPTEVTVDAARFACGQSFAGDAIPIGRPIANARIMILDSEGERVPQGVIGEICVASPGLARGYLNDPDRTGEAFRIGKNIGIERYYRTGDLGRYDRTGLLHFHGRRDRQVKIRGNRVEIDELAGALTSHPDVAVAAIRWVEDAENGGRLVAYVELDRSVNATLTAAGERYRFSLAQRPELRAAAADWQQRHRPALFGEDPEAAALWFRAMEEFPEFHWVLADAADRIEAVTPAIPIKLMNEDWLLSGDRTEPRWQETLHGALALKDKGGQPDALLVVVGEPASPDNAAQHQADWIKHFQDIACAWRLEQLVLADPDPTDGGAVRPLRVEPVDLSGQRRLPLTAALAKAYLGQSLPCYMIPDAVHFLAAIPTTESGKIDERRLPDIAFHTASDRKAAETEVQRELATMVQHLLRLETAPAINDDFFAMGGQSLKAVELVSQVNSRFGAEIDLRSFYREPTIGHLERLLREGATSQGGTTCTSLA